MRILAISVIGLTMGCADMPSLLVRGEAGTNSLCNMEIACPPAERCVFGKCTDVMQEFRTVSVSVRLGEMVQYIPALDLSNSTDRDLALSPEFEVAGQVRTDEDKGIESLVIAHLDGGLTGHSLRRMTHSDEQGNYRLQLTGGSAWWVDILPIDDSIPVPPSFHLRQLYEDRLRAENRFDLVVPTLPEYPVYSGILVDGAGSPLTDMNQAIEPTLPEVDSISLQVRDQNGRRLGGGATFRSDGSFTFRAHPSWRAVQLLLVGASINEPAALSPLLEIDPETTDLGAITFAIGRHRGVLNISASDGNATLAITGELRLRPVAASGLVLHRTAFSASEPTRMELPTGDYLVDLIPDPESGFAPAFSEALTIHQGATTSVQIRVSPLVPIIGQVRTPDGTVAVNARVLFHQREGLVEALTDENGNYSILVQEGEGLLVAIPSPPLPRFILHLNVAGPQNLELEMEEGILLSGQMLRADAVTSMGNAILTVFAPWDLFQGAAVVIAEAIANSDGLFSLSLPNF